MARRIDGYVLRLLCARCNRKFPHVIFSGDTDMATDGLCCLTAAEQNEVIIGELAPAERGLAFDGAQQAFSTRVSQLLERDDLRLVRFIRSELSLAPRGMWFQLFRQKYVAPRVIYSCPICPSGEAQGIEKMDWARFRDAGGQIKLVGEMELIDSAG